MNREYWKGYNESWRGWTGSFWRDRGMLDRLDQDNRNRNIGGGGGGWSGIIIILFIVLVIIWPIALAALVSGTILFIINRVIYSDLNKISYGKAYFGALLTMFVYLIAAVALSVIQFFFLPGLNYDENKFSILTTVKFFMVVDGKFIMNIKYLLTFHVLCTIFSSIIFWYRFHSFFGKGGYIRSLILTACTIPVGIAAIEYGIYLFVIRY
jgi:hypothetical protein